MTNGPEEPTANMRLFARSCRDMFIGLTAEGFSEAQAIQIIGVMVAASLNSDD